MYSYFKRICLLWIINYVSWTTANEGQDKPECPAGKFNVTPLGHSNLLITWESQKKGFCHFNFDFKPVEDRFWDRADERFLFEDGWFKITAPLKENTRYKIDVGDFGGTADKLPNCRIMAKTNQKTNSFPTKPDFKVSMTNELKMFEYGYQPKVRIEWLPCGKKRFCEENEIAGVDFAVRYKILNSTQEWRTNEKYVPYKYIYGIIPGKQYEVVVSSIYGDLLTDSDPQIISIDSVCSAVESVKIMTLPDKSVFISWKSPKQCHLKKDWLGFIVFYHIVDNSPFVFLNYSTNEKPYQEDLFMAEFENPEGVKYCQTKILNLTIGTPYSFFIIPRFQRNVAFGSEYRIDYAPQLYEANTTLAKPDFDYEFVSFGSNGKSCSVMILWLPCGQTYDCKNLKPGSYFTVKYREGNGEIQEAIEDRYERTGFPISVLRKKKYEFWVESVDQSDRAKSESKIIDTSKCEKDD